MSNLTSVLCERRVYSPNQFTHIHPYAQLLIPVKGSLTLHIHSHAVTSDETTVLFVPAKASHSFFAQSRNEFLVFDIPIHFLQPKLAGSQTVDISQPLDARWQAIRTLLACEVGEKPTDSQSIQDLFRYAIHLFDIDNEPASIKFIQQNYHNKVTVRQLAAIEHYTTSHYHEWFQKQTGTTPRLYIQKLRVQKAKELLQFTDFSLQHISQQVGYEHQSTLTKAFQEIEGTTPLLFRNNSRN